MENNRCSELVEYFAEFIERQTDVSEGQEPRDKQWADIIMMSVELHKALKLEIDKYGVRSENTLPVFLESGERLGVELKLLDKWDLVESIYDYMGSAVVSNMDVIGPQILSLTSYYEEQKEEARANIKRNKGSGCIGVIGIVILIGVAYSLLV